MNHFQGASGERRKEPSHFRDFSAYEVSPSYLYKVWAQLQRGGRVIIVPFVLSVMTASPGSDRE